MSKTIRVVVLDDNEVVTGSVKEYFSSNAEIRVVECFTSGKEGQDYLIKYASNYDIIIMDLLLPEVDGISILENLKERGLSKKIIVISSYKDDYTVKKARSLGVDLFMLKPFDLVSLKNRIIEVDNKEKILMESNYDDTETEVSTMLHQLGKPSHILGYQYIREGIMLIYESNRIVTLVTKEIYPQIAIRYNTTTTRVERAIRHAIEISCIRGDLKLMEKLFGNSIDFEKSKPTNSEFLTTIADRLRLNKKEYIA